MANIINGDNGVVSGTAGLKSSSDGTGILALQTNGTTAVTVDANQNVGIGTASPSQRLHVGSGAIQLDNDRDLQWGAGEAAIRSTSSNLRFSISSTERMRIDSSGNLLVGTTSTAPRDFASGGGIALQPAAASEFASASASVSFINYTGSSAGSGTFITFRQQGAARGSISTNGSVTAYNTSSDYRLKNTIAPMTGALAKVSQLKPVTYKWNANNSESEGFIAHELAEVVPQCVTGEKDEIDADGNPVYQGIDVSFLVATLTAAIQEQQALITALTARITALENK